MHQSTGAPHIGLKGTVDDGLRDAVVPIRMQLQRHRPQSQLGDDGRQGLQIDRELRRIAEINEQIATLAEVLRGETAFWEIAD